MRAFAKALGHTIIDEGKELDCSDGGIEPARARELPRRIKDSGADGIIVPKLDHFALSNKGARELR